MREVMVVHQLGLGDYFICNGLVNYFSEIYDRVFVPVKPHNLATVSCLYNDNKKVVVFEIGGIEETAENSLDCYGIPIIEADVYMHRPPSARWYKWYYEQFKLPYEYRFSKFQLPQSIPDVDLVFEQVVGNLTDYRLVHDEPSTGIRVPLKWVDESAHDVPIIKITSSICSNLLSWMRVIENAQEIHLIDSSVFNFIHSIGSQLCHKKIYYHTTRNSQFTYEPYDIQKYSPCIKVV